MVDSRIGNGGSREVKEYSSVARLVKDDQSLYSVILGCLSNFILWLSEVIKVRSLRNNAGVVPSSPVLVYQVYREVHSLTPNLQPELLEKVGRVRLSLKPEKCHSHTRLP